jgi:hypothetical protein
MRATSAGSVPWKIEGDAPQSAAEQKANALACNSCKKMGQAGGKFALCFSAQKIRQR